jgi:hypothetical protein
MTEIDYSEHDCTELFERAMANRRRYCEANGIEYHGTYDYWIERGNEIVLECIHGGIMARYEIAGHEGKERLRRMEADCDDARLCRECHGESFY